MKAVRGILLALAAATACTSTEPGDIGRGTYVLRFVAGEPVPAAIFTAPGGLYLADTVRFEPQALAIFSTPTVERRFVWETSTGSVETTVEFIPYRLDGEEVDFWQPCPVDAVCEIGFMRGSLAGNRMTVLLSPPYRSPLVYERVP